MIFWFFFFLSDIFVIKTLKKVIDIIHIRLTDQKVKRIHLEHLYRSLLSVS